MDFERLTDPQHPMYHTAMALYQKSFPPHEQRETPSQGNILHHPEYHFTLAYDGKLFIGLILYWGTPDFLYVEHFCILPELRNRHYGQRILAELGKQSKTIILEINPPINEISVRRKGFYERCGFTENPYAHVHPPYHPGNPGHRLVVMSSPEKLTPDAYEHFYRFLLDTVMKHAY